MNAGDYEYKGLIASSWDFVRGDTSNFPDRELYRNVIDSSGEPILVVGCGTGRLLLEYLQEGLDAEGVDNSPEMLEICKKKAEGQSLNATLYNQWMETMKLPRRYKTIIVPSSSFQLVPELDHAKGALSRFFNHLLPEGTLIMSIWHIDDEGDEEWGDWWMVFEENGYEGNKSIRKWERAMYDPSTHLRHTETRYEITENGELVFAELHKRSPELRNYSVGQLEKLVEASGFSRIKSLSGFTKNPASADDEVFCVVAEKI